LSSPTPPLVRFSCMRMGLFAISWLYKPCLKRSGMDTWFVRRPGNRRSSI
jgi:hypothetical protein